MSEENNITLITKTWERYYNKENYRQTSLFYTKKSLQNITEMNPTINKMGNNTSWPSKTYPKNARLAEHSKLHQYNSTY